MKIPWCDMPVGTFFYCDNQDPKDTQYRKTGCRSYRMVLWKGEPLEIGHPGSTYTPFTAESACPFFVIAKPPEFGP